MVERCILWITFNINISGESSSVISELSRFRVTIMKSSSLNQPWHWLLHFQYSRVSDEQRYLLGFLLGSFFSKTSWRIFITFLKRKEENIIKSKTHLSTLYPTIWNEWINLVKPRPKKVTNSSIVPFVLRITKPWKLWQYY